MTHQEIVNKLNQEVAPKTSKWLDDADYRFDNRAWLAKSQAIALKILRTIRAQGLTQKELAEKLKVAPQQVSKWVKGQENFTLETLVKIEQVLNISLIEIPMERPLFEAKQVVIFEKKRENRENIYLSAKNPITIKMDYPNISETYQLKIA
jgi:transcriptional regulator with XRE-family HTH domain